MSLGRIVVQKYGGSSVATAEKILAIADRVKQYHETTPHLVVAVSAMGKTTDQLVALARQVSRNPHGRDYDLLLASGEQVAVATLALALHDKDVPAIGLTGAQCNIRTDGSFNRARIQSIDTERIEQELRKGKVVIVAGFQGVTDNDEITTLGRGGGDITGAAVAAALNASVCEICTDVDGVLSADPNVVADARFWPELSYEEAIEMASSGAKVLHPRAAEICMS
jgi:aspartate kinase